ncbi:MAG: serine--tRNA ligase [Aureispira sp.]|nr:serine--tRNA ligase [Aureispira sp.]
MLPVSFIREEKERVILSLKKRNYQDFSILDTIISLDDERKRLQRALDENLAESNAIAKEIGQLFKQGKRDEAETKKGRSTELKQLKGKLNEDLKSTKEQLEEALLQVPNCAHPSVPYGKSDEDNQVHQDWPTALPEIGEEALPHWELAAKYDIIDFKLGVKVTGAGFPVYKGKGAILQRALINFFLVEAASAGYIEYMVPHVVNEDSARGTGQLPDKEGQMYYMPKDELYLIPTAEVPLTNIYRDVILKEDDFPVKLTGHTPCFRREAGSYGAHVRGLNRLHQFDKVEIVQIQNPANSYDALDGMCAHVESLLKQLGLPYRILRLCGGDLGFAAALTFDFETYSAAQKRWLEVSSVSNFEVFQANRLKLRYKSKDQKKPQLVHTLNGSALALPRIMATLLENNQTPEGIKIPVALQPFTGFSMIK